MSSTASSASVLHPSLLPFSIVSYDGSRPADADEWPISNVLSPDPSLFHCSRDGRNFDLVLQYTPSLTSASASCTVTHVVIHGPPSCTAPIRCGVVFASLAAPDVASYSHRYDDLSRAQYEELPPSTLRADGAVAYFTCTDVDHLQTPISLPSWTPARYLHIKLIAALGQLLDDNIDVARIAIVGYPHDLTPAHEVPLGVGVLNQLGLVRQPLGAWNRLTVEHVRALRSTPCALLLMRDPFTVDASRARTLLHEVATSGAYDDRLTFFHSDDSSEEQQLAAQVAASAGVLLQGEGGEEGQRGRAQEDAEVGLVLCTSYRLVITDFSNDRRYHYTGELDDVALRAWLDAYLAGNLTPWRRSETLPPVDPAQPGLTRLTANSFDDLVLHSPQEVLVYVYGQEPSSDSALIHRSLRAAAAALQGVEQVRVAILNAARNDVPPPLTSRENPDGRPELLLLGSEWGKDHPMPYDESMVPSSILTFLHSHMKPPKFDLHAALAACGEVEEEVQRSLAAGAVVQQAMRMFVTVRGWMKAEEVEELKAGMKRVILLVDQGDHDGMAPALTRLQRFLTHYEPAYDGLVLSAKVLRAFASKVAAGKDALTEEETRQVDAAIADLSHHLPSERDSEDEEEEEEEEDEEEEEGKATGGDAQAVSIGEPRPSPVHGVPALRAALARVSQLATDLEPRLDAREAELESKAAGSVVKVHSSAELQAKLAQATAEHRLAVLDFTAVWCGPCKAVSPIVGQLSVEWEAQAMFLKVDVDELEDVAAEYGVSSMPTFVFVRGGKEVEKTRIQGANVPALKRALALLTPDEPAVGVASTAP